MPLIPTPSSPHRSPRRVRGPVGWMVRHNRWLRGRDESGYVLAMAALCLIPLIVVAAFSIDFGSFYTDASKLQRVAESASLAGVVWMPDLTTATTVARAAAAGNGISQGSRYDVTVSSMPGNIHQLKVTITDKLAPQYLSKSFKGSVAITRSAVAQYEQPIPMGSPQNYFGTGNLNSGSVPKENLWAAVSGYCSAHENGDLRLAGFENAYSGSGYDCSTVRGTIVNPDYQATGYLYVVRIPPVAPSSVPIQVYDGAYNTSGSGMDLSLSGTADVTTTYKLLDHAGAPYNPYSHAVLSTLTLNRNQSGYANQWKTVATINNPVAGADYYLQVFTQAGQTNSAGSNGFGLRTTSPSGAFSACTTDPTASAPPYSTGCPRIFPYQEMSVYVNGDAATASFHLAEIDATYAGKFINIGLFDPGEGAKDIQVLDPNGNPVNFTWSTLCTNPPVAPSGGCSGGPTNKLSVSGTGTQPYSRLTSTSKYNDRTMTLRIGLPTNYAATYGAKTWWKIKYTTNSGTVTDRTTWTVGVEGSPVHLVD